MLMNAYVTVRSIDFNNLITEGKGITIITIHDDFNIDSHEFGG